MNVSVRRANERASAPTVEIHDPMLFLQAAYEEYRAKSHLPKSMRTLTGILIDDRTFMGFIGKLLNVRKSVRKAIGVADLYPEQERSLFAAIWRRLPPHGAGYVTASEIARRTRAGIWHVQQALKKMQRLKAVTAAPRSLLKRERIPGTAFQKSAIAKHCKFTPSRFHIRIPLSDN